MENMQSSVWDILASAKFYDWLKAMIETGLKKLSDKINDWLARARRFWDNFAEDLKDRIIKAKSAVDMEIKKVLEKMSSVKRALCSSALSLKEKIIRLKHLVGSMVKCMLKLVETSLKNFFNIMKEVAKVTLKRCKEINDNGNTVHKISALLKGLFELLKYMGCNDYPPVQFVGVVLEAIFQYLKEPKMTMEDMNHGSWFKNLGEKEKKAARFVFAVLVHLFNGIF